MNTLRLFYGSTGGDTRAVARILRTKLGDELDAIMNIAQALPADLDAADALILGTSTWQEGTLQEDWQGFLPRLDEVDLRGKPVALYGLGDAQAYSGLFANGLRILHDEVKARGARIVGHWPTDGYNFEYSAAVEHDRFVGLVIDEVNQSDYTVARACHWIEEIRPALLGIEPSNGRSPMLGRCQAPATGVWLAMEDDAPLEAPDKPADPEEVSESEQ